MQILIAEDDSISRLLLQKAVVRLGHDCLVARDGLEAWERFQASEVEVVISDWMMPGIDGIELCRRVRAAERTSYSYFMMLTALNEKEHVLAGMRAGADDYLSKPLDRQELQVRLIAAARVTSLYRKLAEQQAELQRLNHDLFAQSRRDALTQLGNRLQLREDMERLRAQVERYGHHACLALCDVDQFKRYNDTQGHLAGDEVLRLVAATLAEHVRREDSVYRYGGEEFLLLLPEQTIESGVRTMERLRFSIESLAIPHPATPGGVVTISAGVAEVATGEHAAMDALVRAADAALYGAKEAGRNRVEAAMPLPIGQGVA